MEWVLVAWFISGFNNGIDQHLITTRFNTKTACDTVIREGHRYNLRGVCVHDPISK